MALVGVQQSVKCMLPAIVRVVTAEQIVLLAVDMERELPMSDVVEVR